MVDKSGDERMLWVRILDQMSDSSDIINIEEHEFASDTMIPGILEYGNGKILCGALTFNRDENQLYKYLLRIIVPQETYKQNANLAKNNGYYFKGGAIGELLSLMSLYYQCRIFHLSSSTGDLTSHGLKVKEEFFPIIRNPAPYFDPKSYDGKYERNFSLGLSSFLDNVTNLPQKYHQSIVLSAAHYAKALRESGVDEEMVFIRLVSAIEVVSKWTKLSSNDDKLNNYKIQDLFKTEKLDKTLIEELEKIISHRKAKQKFISTIDSNIKGFFKKGNFKARNTHINKSNLRTILSTIYDARSSYLHNGETMYLSHPMGFGRGWDTDPTFGMIIDRRKFSDKKKLPYGDFFQRLVRHVLLEIIENSFKKPA